MKFGELKSIGHNMGASLASGVGLPIGLYCTNVFQEARSSSEGFLVVDFLKGKVTEGAKPSAGLAKAVRQYGKFLRELCERHGVDAAEFSILTCRFGSDRVYGEYFEVTVANQSGRISNDEFWASSGERIRRRRPHR